MSDVVVTVPQQRWQLWLEEGDFPGKAWSGRPSHFWISSRHRPTIALGERVYIVAYGRVRGYAPLADTECFCQLRRSSACLIRHGGAVAVTIPETIHGLHGWRYRWWERTDEQPFPDWQTAGVQQ